MTKKAPLEVRPSRFVSLATLSIFFTFLALFGANAAAQSTLATSDYADYASSKHARSTYNEYVKEGLGAFHSGDYDMAQKNLYKAFNLGCESPIVLFQLALINEYQKSYYSALEFYQMAKSSFKSSNSGHRYNQNFNENYGRALYFSGKKDEALPLLKASAKKSKSFWLLKMLGMLAYESGDTLNATSYFERAVRIQSPEVTSEELVSIYTLLGRLFLNKSERDGALRNYTKVLELDPANEEAKNYISRIRKTYEQDKMLKMFENIGEM